MNKLFAQCKLLLLLSFMFHSVTSMADDLPKVTWPMIKQVTECKGFKQFTEELKLGEFIKFIQDFLVENEEKLDSMGLNQVFAYVAKNSELLEKKGIKLFPSIIKSFLAREKDESYKIDLSSMQEFIDSRADLINSCLKNDRYDVGIQYLPEIKDDEGKITQEREITLNFQAVFGEHIITIKKASIKFVKEMLVEKFDRKFLKPADNYRPGDQRVYFNLKLRFENVHYKGKPEFESLLPLILPDLVKQDINLSLPLTYLREKHVIETPSGSTDRYYRTLGILLALVKTSQVPILWVDMKQNASPQEKKRIRHANNWLNFLSLKYFDTIKGLISNIKVRIGNHDDSDDGGDGN